MNLHIGLPIFEASPFLSVLCIERLHIPASYFFQRLEACGVKRCQRCHAEFLMTVSIISILALYLFDKGTLCFGYHARSFPCDLGGSTKVSLLLHFFSDLLS